MSTAPEPLSEPRLQCGHRLEDLRPTTHGRVCGVCEDALMREPATRATDTLLACRFYQEGSPAADGVAPDTAPRDDGVVLEGEIEEPEQPVIGRRGTEPGRRGCWAVNRRGEACGASARHGEDYCNAHGGHTLVIRDPLAANARATEVRRREAEHRARVRIALAGSRATSTRGQLKLAAAEHAGRIAGRVVDAILDPSVDPATAAKLGMRLVEVVDPPLVASVEFGMPADPGALDKLSLAELLRLADVHEVEVPALSEASETG